MSGAAAGVASTVATLSNPGRDFGYSLTTKRALFSCRKLAALAIPDGSADPPPPAHAHAHRVAGSSSRLLRASATSAPTGVADPTSLASAFKLHSRSGAPRFMLLDFTGGWAAAGSPSAPGRAGPLRCEGGEAAPLA